MSRIRWSTASSFLVVCLVVFSCRSEEGSSGGIPYGPPPYREIQERLAQGWNTWNTRSVLSHVLLPEGFSINLAFKQHYWLDEKYLKEALIGRSGEGAEKIRPGPHAYDGSYTRLELEWEQLNTRVETATDGDDLVILLTPLSVPDSPVKLIVESGILWNRPGRLSGKGPSLTADLPGRTVNVYTTAETVDDPYVQTLTPYLCIYLEETIGISTGRPRDLEEIRQIVERQKQNLQMTASGYGELSEAFVAVQSGIAWNTIYEPQLEHSTICWAGIAGG